MAVSKDPGSVPSTYVESQNAAHERTLSDAASCYTDNLSDKYHIFCRYEKKPFFRTSLVRLKAAASDGWMTRAYDLST